MKQKKKLNNGGFSLVELIIVIAILVILVGILAPMYIRYVERSRVAADQTTIDEVVSALQVLAADPDDPVEGSITVTWVGKDKATVTTTVADDMDKVREVLDMDADPATTIVDSAFKSTAASAVATGTDMQVTLEFVEGAWKVTKSDAIIEFLESGSVETTPTN